MSPLRRIARAGLARALYSPFGLAWLRARDLGTASAAYRNAQWPTPRLTISALRLIQRLWPPRRTQTGQISSSNAGPSTFYAASAEADAHEQVVVEAGTGPAILVSGQATAEGVGRLMLGISRVQANWPQVAWQFDIDVQPVWLSNVILLSAPPPKKTSLAPCIRLSPPLSDMEIDEFVARALSSRETSR